MELDKSDLPYKLYIEVTVKSEGDVVTVTIIGSHTNVTQIVKNGKIEYNGGCCNSVGRKRRNGIYI